MKESILASVAQLDGGATIFQGWLYPSSVLTERIWNLNGNDTIIYALAEGRQKLFANGRGKIKYGDIKKTMCFPPLAKF